MRRLLLIPIALLGLAAAGALASIRQANVTASGRIAALSSTSITLGKHHHRRTCSITSYSPATTAFSLGDLVGIACSNRVLVAIAEVPEVTK